MLLPSSRVSISCDMSALIVTDSCSCTVSHIRSSISDSAGGSSTPEPPQAVSATSEPAVVMVRSFREMLFMASSFFVLRNVSDAEKIPTCGASRCIDFRTYHTVQELTLPLQKEHKSLAFSLGSRSTVKGRT